MSLEWVSLKCRYNTMVRSHHSRLRPRLLWDHQLVLEARLFLLPQLRRPTLDMIHQR